MQLISHRSWSAMLSGFLAINFAAASGPARHLVHRPAYLHPPILSGRTCFAKQMTSAASPLCQRPKRFQTMCTMAQTEASAEDTEKRVENKPPVRKRAISGVQPTGNLHLGNYLGAIRQWVTNQDENENFFFVVDLHAITAPHDPTELNKATYDIAALYLAAGLDPAKSRIFVQSHVPAHSELCWLLNCCTPMGWMEKMIQYKEKAKKQAERGGVDRRKGQ